MPATQRAAKKASAASRKTSGARGATVRSEEARFEAWLKDFDARQARLASKLDALLLSLGIEPESPSGRESI